MNGTERVKGVLVDRYGLGTGGPGIAQADDLLGTRGSVGIPACRHPGQDGRPESARRLRSLLI